tara:strand:- start:295 stop:720 length:426 start_codon:yes stop_codon:yes gene_type:complete
MSNILRNIKQLMSESFDTHTKALAMQSKQTRSKFETKLYQWTGGGALIILMLLSLLVYLVFTKPMHRLAIAMHKASRGDLDVVVSDHKRRDEIGTIARALALFIENAQANVAYLQLNSRANLVFQLMVVVSSEAHSEIVIG